MMDFTEEMIEKVALDLHGSTKVTVGDTEIDFKRPFRRITMLDAIKEYTGLDVSGMDEAELRTQAKKLNIELDDSMGKGKIIDEIFGEKCEQHFIQPTFIIDYPVEMSPLCKKHRDNPDLTERFELMVNGKEICNAYSELNDPIDQYERFREQLKLSEKGDDEAMFIDLDFVRALEYGMPPTSGMGMGMDRLAMLMTNKTSIQDVLFFPQMRPEKSSEGKVEGLKEKGESSASRDESPELRDDRSEMSAEHSDSASPETAIPEEWTGLSDEEKLVMKLLNEKSPVDLNELKGRTGLSNKKWDTTIKGLRKQNLAIVEKNDEGLWVMLY